MNETRLLCEPRYTQLRDDLRAMCGLRRWLSFRMRQKYRILGHALQYELQFRRLDKEKARREQKKIRQDWENAQMEDRVRELELGLANVAGAQEA